MIAAPDDLGRSEWEKCSRAEAVAKKPKVSHVPGGMEASTKTPVSVGSPTRRVHRRLWVLVRGEHAACDLHVALRLQRYSPSFHFGPIAHRVPSIVAAVERSRAVFPRQRS